GMTLRDQPLELVAHRPERRFLVQVLGPHEADDRHPLNDDSHPQVRPPIRFQRPVPSTPWAIGGSDHLGVKLPRIAPIISPKTSDIKKSSYVQFEQSYAEVQHVPSTTRRS